MQPQVDPAGRPLRSPAFAAYYSERLHELRVRITYLCKRVWDVNAVWLVRHDVDCLAQQVELDDPQADISAWRNLSAQLDTVLEQARLPDDMAREELLAAFRRIDTAGALPDRRHTAVRQSENERVEVPPAAFWRRWANDAAPPTYSDPPASSAASDANPERAFDFGPLDIDAMIAAGKVGQSSLEIVHERIAPQVAAVVVPPAAPHLDTLDDFLPSGDEEAAAPTDYDWNITPPATPAAAPATTGPPSNTGQALDAFWDATASHAPAPAAPAPVEQPVVAAPAPPALAVPPSVTQPAPSPMPPARPVTPTPRPLTPSALPTTPAPPRTHEPISPVHGAVPSRAPTPLPALLSGAGKRIYHLTESDDLACELDQRLEQLEYELELLESPEELNEVLGALTPNLVIVDAQFRSSLEGIGAVLRVARQRSSEPIRLLVLCEADTMNARLAARRAGADALLFDPQTTDEVIARIERILHPVADDHYRVLVVEDDRAQGLFAESILRNAGMEAEVIEDGLKVMETMRRFQPDLVLMDLYLPNCDGAELTALIREHDEFINTPIVFLSGESDKEKHLDALSAGGDDFLSKPIRPKYLIATVNNRIRRARAIQQRSAPVTQAEPFDSGTGLHFRSAMLERLEQSLVALQPAERGGGVLFVEVQNVPALRQRLGLTTVEELLEDVAMFIVAHMGAGAIACRYGDACFLIFDALAGPEQLHANADQIRDTIGLHPFDTPKEIVTLDVTVGMADLREPFADAAAVLNAAERASRAGQPEVQPAPITTTQAGDPARTQEITALLTNAITQGRLDLDFQPIVALQSDAQAQYQTLLRLRRPGAGDITAGEMLPVLRAQDRLPEFDRWALLRAMEVVATRLAIARPVTLFVSQSVETLRQPGYADWLAQQLLGAGRIGASFVIEINAEEIQLDLAAVQAVCTSLLVHDVRFCLSRYAATEEQDSVLTVLPVDLVKVAPEMIARLGSSERSAAFKVLVQQLKERSIGVIAPRVEDTRTAAALWMSGIDYIQGNLVQSAGSSLDFDFNSAVL